MNRKTKLRMCTKESVLKSLDTILRHLDREWVDYSLGRIPEPEGFEQLKVAFNILAEWKIAQQQRINRRREILAGALAAIAFLLMLLSPELLCLVGKCRG